MCNTVIGHKKQKDFFKKIIAGNRLSHSYILSGVSGIGKFLFAKELARSIFCQRGSFFEECSCSSCLQVQENTYPDLYIYEGSDLKVENIRSISEAASMTGLVSKWKIFILRDAEKLSNSGLIVAGNAFLKTLEEPGENSLFLLITSKYDMIMPTIRSRCSLVNFSPLNIDEVKEIYSLKRGNSENTDSIISMSGGSMERAFMLDDLKAHDILDYIIKKDFKSFTAYFLDLNDIWIIKAVMEIIYTYTLVRYKKDSQNKYIIYGEYILEILQRLNYNINIDLTKHDFVSKTIEVFSERI